MTHPKTIKDKLKCTKIWGVPFTNKQTLGKLDNLNKSEAPAKMSGHTRLRMILMKSSLNSDRFTFLKLKNPSSGSKDRHQWREASWRAVRPEISRAVFGSKQIIKIHGAEIKNGGV